MCTYIYHVYDEIRRKFDLCIMSIWAILRKSAYLSIFLSMFIETKKINLYFSSRSRKSSKPQAGALKETWNSFIGKYDRFKKVVLKQQSLVLKFILTKSRFPLKVFAKCSTYILPFVKILDRITRQKINFLSFYTNISKYALFLGITHI